MRGKSLDEAIAEYLTAFAQGAAPGSVRAYAGILRRVAVRLPQRQFSGVTVQDLYRVLYGPGGIAQGKAKQTVNVQRSALRKLFEHGYMMGWRRDLIPIPSPPVRPREPVRTLSTRLTSDQLCMMLCAAEPLMRGMVAVAANTALRVSDVLKIRLGDLDLATGSLVYVAQKTRLSDVLPVTLDLDEEMRRYLAWLTATTGATLRDAGLFLFPGFRHGGFSRTPTPTRHVSYQWANRELGALYTACGVTVEPRERWHTIRRSVARIYFDSLRDAVSHDHALRQTATLLGHKLAATTEAYLGLDAERAARDESLRGKRLIVPSQNVSPLRRGA